MTIMETDIRRIGASRRWSDVVVHRGVAYWVEVAEDMTQDARGQTGQVLAQIDTTLATIGSDRTRLIQILVYVAPGTDRRVVDEAWDEWVPADHPPVRAMLQAELAADCRVEMVVTAATAG